MTESVQKRKHFYHEVRAHSCGARLSGGLWLRNHEEHVSAPSGMLWRDKLETQAQLSVSSAALGYVSGSTWQLGLCSGNLSHLSGSTQWVRGWRMGPKHSQWDKCCNLAALVAELEQHQGQWQTSTLPKQCPPLSTLHDWIHFILMTTLWGKCYFSPYFAYGELRHRA